MHWINSYLHSKYEDGGRGPFAFDCWGMYRHVIANQSQIAIPSFQDISPDDKKGMTVAMRSLLPDYDPCKPEALAAACGMKGKLLIHIGTVIDIDGELKVLHTSRQYGPSLDPIHKFTRIFGADQTRFYRVKDSHCFNLSE